ncbi:MAG: hypothetical protein VB861_20845 [Planctomycetaceae bacterium]
MSADVNFTTPPNQPVPFAMRPASSDWEPLSLDASGACHGWAWFRPPAVPQGVVLRLADGVSATLRGLSLVTGIDPASVSTWVVFGTPCAGPAAGGQLAMLDQPLVLPPGAADANIAIQVAAGAAVAAGGAAGAVVGVPGGQPVVSGGGVVDEVLYTSIEAHWFGIQSETVKLDMLRKQVDSMVGQLKTMNRDLQYEEKEFSTRQDRDAWDDARRWMRISSTQLSRCQKACDVGDTQSVGKREWLQQIHDTYIAPRLGIENAKGIESEFTYFRKLLINLENQLNVALSSASTDALGRASRVLSEIARKIRKAKSS